MVAGSGATDGSPMILYRDGTTSYALAFGTESDGDPIVRAMTGQSGNTILGPTFTLQSAGSGYHLYELIYDPVAGSADLFVDGIERISDFEGLALVVAPNVGWGAGSSADVGEGRYNLVQFEVTSVPEASVRQSPFSCSLARHQPGGARRRDLHRIGY